ncbi:hypothetical protein [Deinococcus yavapaiensis]|uniref:Uncharacterized protein n=1 Tax=Deinococcus yavapaiensis KR-236 TaxID=694435 RepID=A0A318S320_9DEIO|nr:hypothetical protein [Deinococcus yavapaiensis]PYE52891.1 hypothetical protein DES52_11163 [Deinococcus yavapaiensis KR-236]
MLGPLTLIAQDPLIALVLTTFFVVGLVLHGMTQTYALARFGDATALREGYGAFNARHLTVPGMLWFLVLGLAVPRPVPLTSTAPRAARALLLGPLALLAYALVLLLARQLLAAIAPAYDVVSQGMRLAAVTTVLHAVYFLVPLGDLDGARVLRAFAWPWEERVRARLRPVEGALPYLLWLASWYFGVLAFVLSPIWNALQIVLSWLPF